MGVFCSYFRRDISVTHRSVFVLVFEYVQCVGRLWVIVSYVPYVFLVPLLQISASLSNISQFACVTSERVDATFTVFLCLCVCGFGLMSWYKLLVFLNAMPTSVCLKRLVTFLIVGSWQVGYLPIQYYKYARYHEHKNLLSL